MRGGRLIFIYDKAFKIRFIDSYNFLAMKLSKTTGAFNLTTTEKGFFPHKFNRLENVNYVGPYPPKCYYDYDMMSADDQAKFDSWYNEVCGQIFDFKKEIALYCRNDVVLLREACMKFRETLLECTGIDTFSTNTLPSCAMKIYKTKFLTRDTIALTHDKAYINPFKSF